MPIPVITAELALSIATGLIKLGSRVDEAVAESIANDRPVALPDYFQLPARPSAAKLMQELEKLWEASPTPAHGNDDELGDARPALQALIEKFRDPVARNQIGEQEVVELSERLIPDIMIGEVQSDQSRLVRALGKLSGDWDLEDKDIRVFAHYLGPGKSNLQGSLGFRLAMIVADVLAEFTLETQHLFVKDEQKKSIIKAVLTRFSKGDLEDEAFTTELLLKRVLSSTLNGVIDSKDEFKSDSVWLNSLLAALDDSRQIQNAAGESMVDDDYLVGLLKGRGYRRLVAEVLEESAEVVSENSSAKFKDVVSQVIAETALVVKTSQSGFDQFFQEHWADIVRAGFRSVSNHGGILFGDNALLKTSLVAVTKSLSETQDKALFSAATLTAATEAAIAGIAANSEIWADEAKQVTWSKALFSSFASVVASEGLRETFSEAGLESLARRAAQEIARAPELVVSNPGFVQDTVATILNKVADVKDFRVADLAMLVADSVLKEVARHPQLIPLKYAELVGDVTRLVSGGLQAGSVTRIQAEHLINAVTKGIVANPELFTVLHNKLAGAVIEKLMNVAKDDAKGILTSTALAEVGRVVMSLLSARGLELLADATVDKLADEIDAVMRRAMAEAAGQLGKRVDIPSASRAIAMVMEAWARGDLDADTFEAQAFEMFFAALADKARSEWEITA